MLYTSVRREQNGSGWRTDYPWAQRNLLIRLSELTKTHVSWAEAGVPHVWLVGLTDPALLEVKKVPQVTGIGFWRAVGGTTTSERGEETAVAHLRAMPSVSTSFSTR